MNFLTSFVLASQGGSLNSLTEIACGKACSSSLSIFVEVVPVNNKSVRLQILKETFKAGVIHFFVEFEIELVVFGVRLRDVIS